MRTVIQRGMKMTMVWRQRTAGEIAAEEEWDDQPFIVMAADNGPQDMHASRWWLLGVILFMSGLH